MNGKYTLKFMTNNLFENVREGGNIMDQIKSHIHVVLLTLTYMFISCYVRVKNEIVMS